MNSSYKRMMRKRRSIPKTKAFGGGSGVDDFVDGCFGTIGFLLLEARNGVEVTLTVPDLAFHLRGAVQLVPAASSADGIALGVLCQQLQL